MRGAIVVVILLLASVASADSDQATAESERAKAEYAAGNFVVAAEAFQHAYELDPRSEYMFGWAQARRKNGDCPGALELYRKLLAMPLEQEEAAATRQA